MTKQEFGTLLKESKPVGLMLAVLFIVIVLLASIAGAVSNAVFCKKMSALDRTSQPAAGADKIVTFLEGDGKYSGQYVPKELLASDPEDVAAVILCEDGKIVDGVYPNGAVGFVRTRTLSWYDLKTQEVLETATFTGGSAPYSIKENDKSDQYGSHPDSAEMTQWIEEMAQIHLP